MKLTDMVYFVERIAPETERKRYYSISKRRLYQNKQGVVQFLKANKASEFKIFRAEVDWEDCTDEFV